MPGQNQDVQSLKIAVQEIQSQLRELQEPVFFNAHRTLSYEAYGKTVTYDNVRVNVGDGMDPFTGVFTAPKNGYYLFLFTGYSIHIDTRVDIRLNGGKKLLATTFHYNQDASSEGGVISTQTATYLKKGDTVDVLLSGEIFDGKEELYTQFTGMLVSRGNRNQGKPVPGLG